MQIRSFFLSVMLAFLSFPIMLCGQNITKGFIITNEGDTLHGEIKDFGLSKNSQKCFFKLTSDKDFTEYEPSEIFSFRLENKYFISKLVNFEEGSDKLFAEFLVDGIYDLYYLLNNDQLYYLIETDAGEQTLINVNSNFAVSDEGIIAEKKDQYKRIGTLKTILKDYPPIFSKVEKVNIEDSRSMKRLLISYHEGVCTEYECIDYTKKDSKVPIALGISVGAKIPSITFEGDDYSAFRYLAAADITKHVSAYYSIDFMSGIPRIDRLGLQLKLEFSKEKFEYSFVGTYEATTLIEHNYAALILNFNYAIPIRKISAVPYLGIMFNKYYNQHSTHENTLPPGYRYIPILLDDFSMFYNVGLSVDVPLFPDNGLHLRTSFDYRFSFRKPLKVGSYFTYYSYDAIGVSILLLKYF